LSAAKEPKTKDEERNPSFVLRPSSSVPSSPGKLRGTGIAAVNYPTGMNLGGDPSQALIHATTTGTFVISLSSTDLGQGLKTVIAQIGAEALGVPFGPERKLLVNGQAITLRDGRVIQPDDVLGPEVVGTSLAVVGDAARTDNLLEHVRGVDALVIESTYLAVEAELARDHGHLTATQSARLAREAGVGQLILTHISRRYGEREVQAEARAIFPETLVARDFDHFRIQRGHAVERVRPSAAMPLEAAQAAASVVEAEPASEEAVNVAA